MDSALWYVKRVSPREYAELVPDRRVFFNEPAFTELNKDKVDCVYYLVIYRENSARFALIVGRLDNEMRAPFSAPYSYPVSILPHPSQESIDTALEVLEEYCKNEGIGSIRFILPPLFYDEDLLSGWVSAFYRKRYEVRNLDINYALDLEKLNVDVETYAKCISQKGRKGLKRAARNNLEIMRCDTEDSYRQAYRIIEIGHAAKGFPVKMSFDQLTATLAIVQHDAFIVWKDGIGIVAEVLYRVNDRIVQGIYTGTHPDYLNCNGMNMLTYHTIRYYGKQGYKVLDKAIATEDSIPNYGLCDFKENVGCARSLKYTFYRELA